MIIIKQKEVRKYLELIYQAEAAIIDICKEVLTLPMLRLINDTQRMIELMLSLLASASRIKN